MTVVSVAALRASRFSPGTIVRTVSYYEAWQGTASGPIGGAEYFIMSRKSYDGFRGNSLGPVAIGNGGDGTNEWIDFTLATGDVAVFMHDGRIRAHQCGMKGVGPPFDDSPMATAAVNWCARAANAGYSVGSVYSPSYGRSFNLHFDPGFFSITEVLIPGCVYLTGSMVGSYAGAIIQAGVDASYIFKLGKDWKDGSSNASVFEGLRLRAHDVGVESNGSSMIVGDESSGGINSIHFIHCWFQWSQGWMVTVTGDDWRFEHCTFDTASQSGVRLGTAKVAATHTKFDACTWYGISGNCIEAVNQSGLVITGGTAYTAPAQPMSFYVGKRTTNAMPNALINGVGFENVPLLAQVDHDSFSMVNCTGQQVGRTGNAAIRLGGGPSLAGLLITNNDFVTAAGSKFVAAEGTGLRVCTISNNDIVSTGNTAPALELPGPNANCQFGGNRFAGFAPSADKTD